VRRLTSTTSTQAGRILSPALHYRGYLQHGLGLSGKTKTARLNRLVCEAFHGPAPSAKHQAAHRDDNRANNTADNLYWATKLENEADKDRNGGRRRGSRVGWAKLTEQDAREIVARVAAGESRVRLAAEYGVSNGLIGHVIKGRAWVHATGLSG
jgi:hypothetical protein